MTTELAERSTNIDLVKPHEYIQGALRTEHTPNIIFKHRDRLDEPQPAEAALDRRLSRMLHAILGMVSEVGELADAFKRHLMYNKPLDEVNLLEEMGDKAWYDALFLSAMEFDLIDVWQRNLAKLRARYPDKFSSERALNRDLDAERAALEAPKAVSLSEHDLYERIKAALVRIHATPTAPIDKQVDLILIAVGGG